jgi:hypothetical protein
MAQKSGWLGDEKAEWRNKQAEWSRVVVACGDEGRKLADGREMKR